jgi:hypothetical protein
MVRLASDANYNNMVEAVDSIIDSYPGVDSDWNPTSTSLAGASRDCVGALVCLWRACLDLL